MRESTALLPASESALFMITRNLVLKAFNRSIRDYRSVRHARFSTSSIFCLFFLTRQVLILSLFKMISTRTNHNLVSGEEDGKKEKKMKKVSHSMYVWLLWAMVNWAQSFHRSGGPRPLILPVAQWNVPFHWSSRLASVIRNVDCLSSAHAPAIKTSFAPRSIPLSTLRSEGQWLWKVIKSNIPQKPWEHRKNIYLRTVPICP